MVKSSEREEKERRREIYITIQEDYVII